MAETFHIITEASEALITEAGDFLVYDIGLKEFAVLGDGAAKKRPRRRRREYEIEREIIEVTREDTVPQTYEIPTQLPAPGFDAALARTIGGRLDHLVRAIDEATRAQIVAAERARIAREDDDEEDDLMFILSNTQ